MQKSACFKNQYSTKEKDVNYRLLLVSCVSIACCSSTVKASEQKQLVPLASVSSDSGEDNNNNQQQQRPFRSRCCFTQDGTAYCATERGKKCLLVSFSVGVPVCLWGGIALLTLGNTGGVVQ